MVPKFRAWDIKYKMMMRVNQIDFEKKTVWLEADNGDHENRHTLTREFKDVILMQSTGLKDKNKVEIFEGDIVSVRNHPFQKTEKSGAGIEIDGDYAISWNEGDLTWCAGNLLLARLKPYVTVAGNIYENPELLEQANES